MFNVNEIYVIEVNLNKGYVDKIINGSLGWGGIERDWGNGKGKEWGVGWEWNWELKIFGGMIIKNKNLVYFRGVSMILMCITI